MKSLLRSIKRFVAGATTLFLVFGSSQTVLAQDSSFILTANSLEPYYPSYLGNGYLSLATSRLAITPDASYMVGVYDHGEGDVPRIAELPAWNVIDVRAGGTWLHEAHVDDAHMQSFRQVLNMYDGTLKTSYEWREGKTDIAVEIQSFVSRVDRNLAVVRLTVCPQSMGRLQVAFPLGTWPSPRRFRLAELDTVHYGSQGGWPEVWYPGHMSILDNGLNVYDTSGVLCCTSESDGRKTQVAQAITVTWPSGLHGVSIDTTQREQDVAIEVSFDASAGSRYSFCKYVAVFSGPETSSPLRDAIHLSSVNQKKGFKHLLRDHADSWHRLWKTDIVIDGKPALQRAIHSMLYYLLCSVREGTNFAIPPMGLSTAGYYGHVFWDSDTWMFPPLLLLHPALARSLIMFRVRTLDAARENARSNGYQGAMYPWEADERGQETTPKFAYQNALCENHIVGDVAMAQWQYFLATSDTSWLEHDGYGVIKETANFWVSRVTFDAQRRRYDILRSVSVDEGLIGIRNDSYTTAIAIKNLQIAERASAILGRTPNPLWNAVTAGLAVPYDSLHAFHPTYEDAPPATLGSVCPLLSYPIEIPMNSRAKLNDLLHALKRTAKEGPGAMMTVTLYPVVAAELGMQHFVDSLVEPTYVPFLKPPFNVLSETPQNSSINFLTGAGGFLQQVVFGHTGLRFREEGLVRGYKPILPRGVSKVRLMNVSVRGKLYTIEVVRDSVVFHVQ